GLPRRRRRALHAPPGEVVPGVAGGHHLDRAAGEAERRRPHRALARPTRDLLDRGQQEAAGKFLLKTHLLYPRSAPARTTVRASLVAGSSVQRARRACASLINPTPDRRGATRRRTRRERRR